MKDDFSRRVYTVEDIYTAYNWGMEFAIRVLEEAEEELTPEGRRYLIEELKRDIAESTEECCLSSASPKRLILS